MSLSEAAVLCFQSKATCTAEDATDEISQRMKCFNVKNLEWRGCVGWCYIINCAAQDY